MLHGLGCLLGDVGDAAANEWSVRTTTASSAASERKDADERRLAMTDDDRNDSWRETNLKGILLALPWLVGFCLLAIVIGKLLG